MMEARANGAVDSATQTFMISVNGINDAPNEIELSRQTVVENTDTTNPLFVGSLSVSDPDPGDTHSFTLVTGFGSEDNSQFLILGNSLGIERGTVLDFETKPSYSIRVRATDSGGLFTERRLTINVRNLVEVESVQIDDGTAQRSAVAQPDGSLRSSGHGRSRRFHRAQA